MTKSADFGMFREDAYIVQVRPSYRFVRLLGKTFNTYHYCQQGVRLDDTRQYVRDNISMMKIQDVRLLSKPWQCECDVSAAPQVNQLITVFAQEKPSISITVKGLPVTGSAEDIRALLGL
jgi:hypothetical protein